jgi:ABC-type uncharacterized transport system permease subunit
LQGGANREGSEAVSKSAWWNIDAAGWVFWLIVFVVLAGPCIYGAWHIVYPDTPRAIPIVTGMVLAAVGAGVVSWAVNSVIQRQRKKQRIARRKKAQKQK